jgi:predicted DNA binding CopG/RHH family protein
MARKPSASSARDKRPARNAKHIPDQEIDFSDIPESTDEELARATRVGRPKTGSAKQLIAFRIDPALLVKLRKLAAKKGRPYQTLLHEILESAVKKAA